MTNTHFYDIELDRLGFEPEDGREGWWFHESEDVRFVWADEGSRAFELHRFLRVQRSPKGVYASDLYGSVSGSGLHTEDFRDVLRAFLRF